MSRKHLLSHASGTATRDAQVPMKPEIMLTVSWFCPACGYPLTLTKRMRAEPGYRQSTASRPRNEEALSRECVG